MKSTLAIFESLESRRLLSATVVDQVLGIVPADSAVTPQASQQLFQFTPNPNVVFTTIPNITGFYNGGFSVKGGGSGSFTLNLTSQNGKIATGTGTFVGHGFELTLTSLTARINLHGGLLITDTGSVSTVSFGLTGAGHLDAAVTEVTDGGWAFTTSFGTNATGHFSLNKIT